VGAEGRGFAWNLVGDTLATSCPGVGLSPVFSISLKTEAPFFPVATRLTLPTGTTRKAAISLPALLHAGPSLLGAAFNAQTPPSRIAASHGKLWPKPLAGGKVLREFKARP